MLTLLSPNIVLQSLFIFLSHDSFNTLLHLIKFDFIILLSKKVLRIIL